MKNNELVLQSYKYFFRKLQVPQKHEKDENDVR